MIVKLSDAEMHMALAVNTLLRVKTIKGGIKDPTGGKPDDEWKHTVIGGLGELAFCKAMNIFWSGNLDTFKKADALKKVQIRCTAYEHGYLTVYENDNTSHDYVLVTGCDDTFRLAGFISGADAKKPEYFGAGAEMRMKAYKVEQRFLKLITPAKIMEWKGL